MNTLSGTFTAVTSLIKDGVINVTLEQQQLNAVIHHAPIPTDNSEEAQWGREFLRELEKLKKIEDEKTGKPHAIHFHIRNYWGEPL